SRRPDDGSTSAASRASAAAAPAPRALRLSSSTDPRPRTRRGSCWERTKSSRKPRCHRADATYRWSRSPAPRPRSPECGRGPRRCRTKRRSRGGRPAWRPARARGVNLGAHDEPLAVAHAGHRGEQRLAQWAVLRIEIEQGYAHGPDILQAGGYARAKAAAVAASCCRTCASIHSYVRAKPASSEIRGSQPSTSRSLVLSELRPRTPCGPGTCCFASVTPAVAQTRSAS